MALRYLWGPVPSGFSEANLRGERQAGRCLTFSWRTGHDLTLLETDTWETFCARLPGDWRPDFVVLYLPYARLPAWLWSAPLLLVGLAADWPLLWHHYRRRTDCDLVLTDPAGVDVFLHEGFTQVRPANLFGCDPALLENPPASEARDIDLFIAANLHAAVQRERLAWLGRLAKLGRRWNVRIATGVFGDDYRRLLARSRIGFNCSARGEWNLRVGEVAAAGALLFQEAENREVPNLLQDGRECVCYTDDNLEERLDYYLTHEEERARIAAAAQERIRDYTFPRLWDGIRTQIEADWATLLERAARRVGQEGTVALLGRVAEACSSTDPADPTLIPGLGEALQAQPKDSRLHNGLGLAVALDTGAGGRLPADAAGRSAGYFQQALRADPGNVLAGLNFAETLVALKQSQPATALARGLLEVLAEQGEALAPWLDGGHFPPGYDLFRVEWERAAWAHAGQPAAEARAKRRLLRWRLHALLASATGAVSHYFEAAVARPDLPVTRAALGCALARAGRFGEAVPHLRAAVDANPFDRDAARALFDALGKAGNSIGQRRFAHDRRLLSRAAPEAVPPEDWFMQAAPVGDELVSILILCCNQLDFTRQCLESVRQHTRAPYELVLVDNGSSDGTAAYLDEVRGQSGPEHVVVLRNVSNVGFPAGCNQALAQAQGSYVVFLNNDTIVTEGWLDGLVRVVLHDWPRVGMAGAVTNATAAPQLVPAGYGDLAGLPAFAAHRRQEFAGKALEAQRLTGFCLLARRDVLNQVGGYDERYGLGYFDDDDLCVRVRRAGFKLLVALDVFIHHYGSQTFKALGIDCQEQLHANFTRFKDKWGPEEAAHYHLPPPPDQPADGVLESPHGPAVADGDATPVASLVMMVRNEEANLPACLASVEGLFADLVIVDTGSTDRTRELARERGARVFEFPWCDSFSAARNEGLRHARGRYVFWMDADDRLDADNRERLRHVLGQLNGANVAYLMKCLCVPDQMTGTATSVDHVRLFPRHPQLRWDYRVHEQILPGLRQLGIRIEPADVTIHHTGYFDPALRRRKLERDLRLLELERQERPEDPFVLFNLGQIYQETHQLAAALVCLERSRQLSRPADSIVHKLYAMIAHCQRELGRPADALATCQAGQLHHPGDVELLFQEALARQSLGDQAGEEAGWKQVLAATNRPLLGSEDIGLRGFKARHNLAVMYLKQRRGREAEEQWNLALAEAPGFFPAALGLAQLYQEQGRWPEVERLAQRIESGPGGEPPAARLRAQALLVCRQYAGALQVLDAALARHPRNVSLWVARSYVLLQEGRDPIGAEQTLQRVLDLDPGNDKARRNLAVLRRQYRAAG
jgi:GT2 family glycosyltransferase/tetratricopeptide (TPR) repeat protein